MKQLMIGETIKCLETKGTGLTVGTEYSIASTGEYNFQYGYYIYKMQGGYQLNHEWLVKGLVEVVEPKPVYPFFKVGDIVRVKETKYSSVSDGGKRGMVTRKHWGPVDGVEVYGVVLEGSDDQFEWSYRNEELEAAQ